MNLVIQIKILTRDTDLGSQHTQWLRTGLDEVTQVECTEKRMGGHERNHKIF